MPLTLPTLETGRLKLRPFALADAKRVQELAGDPDIAAPTLGIPHPYPDGAAEAWISTHAGGFDQGTLLDLSITLKPHGELIGAVGLSSIDKANARAELGYWIGKPYWNQGYCTEACRAIIEYGFCHLDLNRVQARHLPWNPASGRVMQKLGMTREGVQRQVVRRPDCFHDLVVYSLLRAEFDAGRKSE
jgi:ribosomal-protein-alanine N-acetyltransferase